MSIFELLRLSASALAANRVRSALTVLSITIGAFAIVLMSSLAESGLNTMIHGIEELGGGRILLVWTKKPERGEDKATAYRRGLRTVDRDRITEGLPHMESVTLLATPGELDAMTESGLRERPSVVASDAQFFDTFKMPLDRGRLFTDDDNRQHAAVCVIGKKVVSQVYPAPAEPLGQLLTVGTFRCRIIGVLGKTEKTNMNFGFDWSDLVVVPGESLTEQYTWMPEAAMLFVKTDATASNDIVKRLINQRMLQRHAGLDDFQILDFAGEMESAHQMFAVIELIVAVLSGIALFVGGVGVMNMMLVAVSERVTEIGLRKALGASPRAIGAQFLIESALLSMFGGAAGVGAGLAAAMGIAALIAMKFETWQSSFAPWSAVSALAVTLVIGIGFGWLPAKRAAGLDPVEAMRR